MGYPVIVKVKDSKNYGKCIEDPNTGYILYPEPELKLGDRFRISKDTYIEIDKITK